MLSQWIYGMYCPARDVMVRDMVTFQATEDVSKVREVLKDKSHNHNGFPVVVEEEGHQPILVSVIREEDAL